MFGKCLGQIPFFFLALSSEPLQQLWALGLGCCYVLIHQRHAAHHAVVDHHKMLQ